MRMIFLDRDPEAVILVDPRLVGAAGDVPPPGFLVKVPVDGLTQSGIEADAASAAEFGREFLSVDRVAVVVAGPVGPEADQRKACCSRSRGTGREARRKGLIGGESIVERLADQADHVAVVAFVAAAD